LCKHLGFVPEISPAYRQILEELETVAAIAARRFRPCCGNCAHWDWAHRSPGAHSSCRRRAPGHVSGPIDRTEHPVGLVDDYCSEHVYVEREEWP